MFQSDLRIQVVTQCVFYFFCKICRLLFFFLFPDVSFLSICSSRVEFVQIEPKAFFCVFGDI